LEKEVSGMLKGSVKHKLLLMISVLILVSVSTATILTDQSYRKNLLFQSTKSTRQLLEQLSINLDTYLDELFRLCLSPYYNRRVMEQLEIIPANAAGKLNKQRIIEDYLAEMMTLPRSDILRAYIFSDGVYSSSKTRISSAIDDYLHESWYQQALESNEAVFIPAHTEGTGRGTLEVFSVVQRINSISNSSKLLGVIRVDANYQGIKAVCDRAGIQTGGALFIWDDAGNQMYGNNLTGHINLTVALKASHHFEVDTEYFSFSLGGNEYLVHSRRLRTTDWHIVDVHSLHVLMKDAENARNKALVFALLCAILGVVVSIPLIRVFLRPMLHVTELMHTAQSGDLTVRAIPSGHDEFSYLAVSFNDMLAQIQEQTAQNDLLTRQIYEARYLEKEAQYTVLCNQIQPHFLFNALNTIHLLIKTDQGEQAVQSIAMLATLLRGMVNAGREISLCAEMKLVESYLSLQQKRYRGLQYTLPDVTGWDTYFLPTLTIQPIVENALVHGCEPKRGDAQIIITLQETTDAILLRVQDNGLGIDEKKECYLQKALAQSTTDPEKQEGGVGLVNIARRVKLRFGPEYGLSFETYKGQGTCVTLRLPPKGESNVSCADC
jgi:two-component system sensor histidine kinase YesM